MLDNNKIYNEDCLVTMSKIENNYVDLVVLDPPYNVNAADWDKIDGYLDWMKNVISESFRILKPNGSLYLWGMTKNNDFLRLKLWIDDTFKEVEFKNWIVELYKCSFFIF